jgi:uncharacterized protein DUF4159
MRPLVVPVLAVALFAAFETGALAQRRWNSSPIEVPIDKAPPYDGRFEFARLKFTTGPGGYYFRGLPAWAHGYSTSVQGRRAEDNLVKILNSVTDMKPHVDGTRVVDVSDPELFEYPIVYATEAGFMALSDKDAAALHDYLQKGGFIIFDDFRERNFIGGDDWYSFTESMQRVLPGEHLREIPLSHPIFHAFFDIGTLEFHQAYDSGTPAFYGIYEHDDPHNRLQIIANLNNDVSEYWEYSDTGFAPIDLSNEAYKLGVNYIIYGMTH